MELSLVQATFYASANFIFQSSKEAAATALLLVC